jgi:membrane associated rhomboid family serine protease
VYTQLASCYRHPDRETGVRCQRCERPICTECMVPADVGYQCVECVRSAPSRVVSARRLIYGYRPYVTYSLIALNLLVFAAGLAWPLVAAEWWRLVTAAFLHTGLLHVGLNMAGLFVFGPPLERTLGRLRFSGLYLASLLAGSLGALALSPNSLTVGASGAIFGLLGAIIAGQRATGVNPWSSGMIGLLIVNLVFTVAVPGISVGGHLGGLAGGLVAGTLLFSRGLRLRGPLLSVVLLLGLSVLFFLASLWLAGHPLRA